jgi:processive 1,2-diacylglycerol beta-glucosyltransferase
MELPMLLHEPIPGPETENAVYVAGNGAAVWIQDNEKLGLTLGQLLSKPAELAHMRRQAGRCKRPQAAGDIVDAIAAYAKPQGLVNK